MVVLNSKRKKGMKTWSVFIENQKANIYCYQARISF
jgi:hypothetical protein